MTKSKVGVELPIKFCKNCFWTCVCIDIIRFRRFHLLYQGATLRLTLKSAVSSLPADCLSGAMFWKNHFQKVEKIGFSK